MPGSEPATTSTPETATTSTPETATTSTPEPATRGQTISARLLARARRATAPSPEAVEKARMVLADAIALALEARATPVGRTVGNLLAAAAPGASSVIGFPRPVPTETAVLANSVLIHSLLLDDAHAGTMVHPGAVVLPVALAVAEETDADGDRLVAGIRAGYAAFVAVAEPIAQTSAARGFRNTALFGAVGAAATAGTLLALDDERLTAAMSIASGVGGGTLQAFRSGAPDWRFQPGVAALNGLAAARLAAALDPELLPFPAGGIEGPGGLYDVISGAEGAGIRPPSGDAFEAPGAPGELRAPDALDAPEALLHVTHKLHATCGANQVPVAALSQLLDGARVSVSEIARIDVRLSRSSYEYPGCEDYGPLSAESALLSRPFALAAIALAGGGLLRRPQLEAALADDRLPDLMACVHSRPVPDEELSTPQDAWVELTLHDGRVLSAGHEDVARTSLRPEWPMIAERLAAVAGRAGSELLEAIRGLPGGSAREILARSRIA